MATKYLYRGAAGSNLGTLADPWQTGQDAMNGLSAGDEVLSYDNGGETISSSIVSATAGTSTTIIRFTATNSSYVDDGTLYEIDGNAAATNCLSVTHAYYIFKNFTFTDATDDGVSGGASFLTFLLCKSYSNGAAGFDLGANCSTVQTQAYSNATQGFDFVGTGYAAYCISYSNTSWNFVSGNNSNYYRCLSYDGHTGYRIAQSTRLIGCIGDDNVYYNLHVLDLYNYMTQCIFSNTAAGYYAVTNSGTVSIFSLGSAYYNNTTGNISTAANYVELLDDIQLTADPFENQSGRNYNLAVPNTDLIGVAFWLDDTNVSYDTYGLPPEYSEGGGNLIDGSLVI